jgi:hypothetical protein
MTSPASLFDIFGLELEYMVVDPITLNVKPAVDEIMKAASGEYAADFVDGPITWSNELVSHVIEVKVSTPALSLSGLANTFQASLNRIHALADGVGVRLMPTAMHPWMNPKTETHLWPHECAEIYETYHQIFDCYRHGWANLQSAHLNLPFNGDDEFARLHAAIRLVLPLIPALAASSPIMDGKLTGVLDSRLDVYCNNSRLVPEVTGDIIPEAVFSQSEYYDQIFKPMFAAIKPYDKDGILEHEFLNARGAIARFDRQAIEIRLIDVQECPAADVAIIAAVTHAVRMLVEERFASLDSQKHWTAPNLKDLLSDIIRDTEQTVITHAGYCSLWGMPEGKPSTAGDIWKHIMQDMPSIDPEVDAATRVLMEQGPLARRMLNHLSGNTDHESIRSLYAQLADCLKTGQMFM